MPRCGLVRMRLAWSAAALLALLRRWAGFIAVVAGVLGIGYFVAAIGWPALPVLWASSLPPRQGLAVLIIHAGVATALAWGLREALLPAHWLLAERALPLTTTQRTCADLAVVALAQSPLFLLYAASLLSWRHVDPAWLLGAWPRGLAFMAASVLLSLGLSTGLLALRRVQWHRPQRWAAATLTTNRGRDRLRAWTALLLLPLWRGPARAVALLLGLTTAALLALLGAAAAGLADLRWCLAAYALAVMVGCSQAHARARLVYAPLIAVSHGLPLDSGAWPHHLRMLALLPVVLTWPALLALLVMGPSPLSRLIAPAYLLAAWAGPFLQFIAPSQQAEARAARWLFALAVWVALATEILKR